MQIFERLAAVKDDSAATARVKKAVRMDKGDPDYVGGILYGVLSTFDMITTHGKHTHAHTHALYDYDMLFL